MVHYLGIDASASSPAIALLGKDNTIERVGLKHVEITSILESLSCEPHVRVTIERPPLVNTRLASAHFAANEWKRKVMELVPRAQVQFVHPASWQSRMLGAKPRDDRKMRKSVSLIRAKSRMGDPNLKSDDIADAINIADYGRAFLTWEDTISKEPIHIDINEIDLLGVDIG